MSTVDAAIHDGARQLPRRTGVLDPVRESRWLLAAAWGVSETWLRARPAEPVPAEVERRFGGWIARRAAGEPAEHLAGSCRFWGRDFEVSPAVLVPRPETELVVEAALSLPLSRQARVLDVGTGSGCLAATLAAERPLWRVTAVDRSLAALEIARRNMRRHTTDLPTVCADLTATLRPAWDLVVANLPYIPTGRMAALPVEVTHDPRLALDGGTDGLDLVRRLLSDLPRLLRSCGGVVLELGEHQAEQVVNLARVRGLQVARRLRDASGCDRVVVLQSV